jgi:hypothetical protein
MERRMSIAGLPQEPIVGMKFRVNSMINLRNVLNVKYFISMDEEGGRQTIEKVINSLHNMVAQLEEKEKHLELENIYLKERLANRIRVRP